MRVHFVDDIIREDFFDKAKTIFNKSWIEICSDLAITKSVAYKYRSGKLSLPEDLFNRLLKLFNNSDQHKFKEYIQVLQDNHGQVNGGKIAYKLNFRSFEFGRNIGCRSVRKIKREKKVNLFKIDIDDSVCQVVGAFIGDGFFNCYNRKYYHLEFSGDSRFDIDYYKKVIIPSLKNICPSINPHFYFVKGTNILRVVIYSKELFYLLKENFGFDLGKKVYSVKIPDRIMNSGKKKINLTIRGIFDTDGCIYLDKRKSYSSYYPRITLATVSKDLYNQLFNYLSDEFRVYSRYDLNRKIYFIEIYGKSQVKKWMEEIGFSNPRHLNKLAKLPL